MPPGAPAPARSRRRRRSAPPSLRPGVVAHDGGKFRFVLGDQQLQRHVSFQRQDHLHAQAAQGRSPKARRPPCAARICRLTDSPWSELPPPCGRSARRVRPEEALAQPRQRLRGDAGRAVVETQRDSPAPAWLATSRRPPGAVWRRLFSSRLADHLTQAVRVAVHPGRRRHRHAFATSIRAARKRCEGQRLVDQRPQVAMLHRQLQPTGIGRASPCRSSTRRTRPRICRNINCTCCGSRRAHRRPARSAPAAPPAACAARASCPPPSDAARRACRRAAGG